MSSYTTSTRYTGTARQTLLDCVVCRLPNQLLSSAEYVLCTCESLGSSDPFSVFLALCSWYSICIHLKQHPVYYKPVKHDMQLIKYANISSTVFARMEAAAAIIFRPGEIQGIVQRTWRAKWTKHSV